MEDYTIENDQITTSSGNGYGRLNEDTWIPSGSDGTPYIEVEFQYATQITGVTVKGKGGKYYENVVIMYTIDGVSDEILPEGGGIVSIFSFLIQISPCLCL